MTAHVIEGESALDAWKAGVDLLLANGGELNNLVTTINRPCDVNPQWLVARSPHKFFQGADDIRDVANTLFPLKVANRAPDRDSLYRDYLVRHDRVKRWNRGRHSWGTYFERLTRFPPTNVNQLERVINKLQTWPRNTTGLVFHLSSPVVDAPRTRGGPCWHFGEIVWKAANTIDLVAVYRNHDFFNKVLGNFIGLGQLLNFICTESGKAPGAIVCHSVHAYQDGSVRALRTMAA